MRWTESGVAHAIVSARIVRQTPSVMPNCDGCWVMVWPWFLKLDVRRVEVGQASRGRQLTLALQHGRETGMAVGVLMERYKTDRETAFRALRDYARSHQRKLNDVAVELLAATEMLSVVMGRGAEVQVKQ